MPRSRPPYPPEFREQILELVKAGRSPEELAQEFEPTAQTIRNWIRQAELDAGERQDELSSPEREELAKLRRESARRSSAALELFEYSLTSHLVCGW